MLKAFKSLFDDSADAPRTGAAHEQRQLQLAVASVLHEATRVDLSDSPAEQAAAKYALLSLFGLSPPDSVSFLREGRDRARRLTSYYAPMSVIKREFDLQRRVLLVEHLWRIAYADGHLDQYEDHFVRKIAHLLHVPNTQCILARNRARAASSSKA